MYYNDKLGVFTINQTFPVDFLQLIAIAVGVFISIIIVVFAVLFWRKRKVKTEKRGESKEVYKPPPVEKRMEIPEPRISNEEVLKVLNSLSGEVSEIKRCLRNLTRHLEYFLAKVPSLAGALSKYSITPINDLQEAIDYLNLNEIVIFLDTGLPLESYPLPVDEKKTGILMEVYRSTKELFGEKIRGVTLLMPEETITIYEVKVNDRTFYVAYKVKAGIGESLLDIQKSMLAEYVKKRIKELSR